MFASQRPVPSTAALRILRQLAYISSGTVCGAAALIAEERRRQTNLAKKIVDNTRRLKQHPRHARAHSHAATAPQDDDRSRFDDQDMTHPRSLEAWDKNERPPVQNHGEEDLSEARVVRTPHTTRQRSTGARGGLGVHTPERVRAEPDAFRNSQLPSEVDKGYRKLTKRNNVRNHEHGQEVANPTATPEHRNRQRGKHQTIEELFRTNQRTTDPFALGAKKTVRLPHHNTPSSLPVEGIKKNVGTFLERARGHPSDAIKATRLLATALEANMLDSSIDMCYWLMDTDHLNAEHVAMLARRSINMFATHEFGEVETLYQSLLLDNRIGHIDDELLVHSKLYVTAAILGCPTQLSLKAKMPLLESLENRHPSLIQKQLMQCCNDLLKDGEARAATRLFLHCANDQDLVSHEGYTWLVNRLFQGIANDGMLLESELLLHKLEKTDFQIEPLLDTLLHSCATNKTRPMLLRLHERYSPRFSRLYPAFFAMLAEGSDWKLATNPVWNTERPTENHVVAACQSAWALYLKRMATVTNSLELVKKTFAKMSAWAGEGHVGIQVYNSMIEASVNAGQPDEAKRLLRQMQERDSLQPDLVTFGWFVLFAARKQDWLVVEELLTVANTTGETDAQSEYRANLFHQILREHVKSHNSNEIWNFASRAIHFHGITPTSALCDTVIVSFVRCKSLDLIPRWIDYIRSLGLEGGFGARTAKSMIRRFYYDTRPSHVYMLQLCRNLSAHAPDMISEDLVLLVQDAITHDIRRLRGANAVGLRALAEARLMSLIQANGSIPRQMQWFGSRSGNRERALEALKLSSNSDKPQSMKRSLSQADTFEFSDHPDAILEETPSANPDERPEREDGVQVQSLELPATKILVSSAVPGREPMSAHEEESKMLLYLSIDHPAEAVRLYKSVLEAKGLPHSSISLDVAIQASLKAESGHTMQAEEMLADAQEAGYNVTAALTPLLIHRIQNAEESEGLNVNNLRQTVQKFYEEMVANNIPIKHHVLTTAASVLLKANKPAEASSLLSNIFSSAWNTDGRPFDTPAMTVWLQCYIKLSRRDGVDWVIDHILRHDLRIDHGLVSTLKRAYRHFKLEHEHTGRETALALHHRIKRIHALCRHRQSQQISALRFGQDLIECIIRCSRQAPPIEAAKREEIETELLGERWDMPPWAKKRHFALDKWMAESGETGSKRLPSRKRNTRRDKEMRRMGADETNAETPPKSDETKTKAKDKPVRRRAIVVGRKDQAAWRALLRRGLVDEEGRKMRFRYVDATAN